MFVAKGASWESLVTIIFHVSFLLLQVWRDFSVFPWLAYGANLFHQNGGETYFEINNFSRGSHLHLWLSYWMAVGRTCVLETIWDGDHSESSLESVDAIWLISSLAQAMGLIVHGSIHSPTHPFSSFPIYPFENIQTSILRQEKEAMCVLSYWLWTSESFLNTVSRAALTHCSMPDPKGQSTA